MIKKINTVKENNSSALYKKAVECIPLPKASLTSMLDPEEATSNWPEEVVQCVRDLLDTAYSLGERCFGLAANQIWDKDTPPPAIFVAQILDPDDKNRYKYGEFINPKLTTSGKSIKLNEGCFSKPNSVIMKKRELNSTVTFQTLHNLEPITLKIMGKENSLAIILQHEFEHLQGKLI